MFFKSDKLDVDVFLQSFQAFLSGQHEPLDLEKYPKTAIPALVDALINETPLVATDQLNDFLQSDDVSDTVKLSVSHFVERIKSEQFIYEALVQSLTQHKIVVYLAHLDQIAVCNKSFHSSVVNLLQFDYDGGRFFVFQYVSSYDGVYFPDLNLFLITGHGSKVLFLTEVVKLFFSEQVFSQQVYSEQVNAKQVNAEQALKVQVIEETPRQFGGVLTSHGRPSHAFYDSLPAFYFLHTKALLSKLPNIVQLEGYDYADLPVLFPEVSRKQSVTLKPAELSKRQKRDNSYYFHVGLLFKPSVYLKLLNTFDKYVVKSALQTKKLLDPVRFEGIDDCLLIWFGVSAQKRAWIEQVDACVALMNQLSEVYPAIALVVDGWTNPLSPRSFDIEESRSDQLLCDEIQARLYKNIRVYSVIGATPYTKIQVASRVKFFVANQMTGSMFVSRFCEKPGVTHMSKAFFKDSAAQSINKNAVPYPVAGVKDLQDDADKRMDQVSYSIDVKAFIDFSWPLIEKQLARFKDSEAFSRQANRLNLLPHLDAKKDLLRSKGGTWQSTGNDPVFKLDDALFAQYTAGRYCISVRINFIETLAEKPNLFSKLYLDYGEGFAEKNAIIIPLIKGEGSEVFSLEQPVSAMRFDPVDIQASFKVEALYIDKLEG